MKPVNKTSAISTHAKGEQRQNRRKSKGAGKIETLRLHEDRMKRTRGK